VADAHGLPVEPDSRDDVRARRFVGANQRTRKVRARLRKAAGNRRVPVPTASAIPDTSSLPLTLSPSERRNTPARPSPVNARPISDPQRRESAAVAISAAWNRMCDRSSVNRDARQAIVLDVLGADLAARAAPDQASVGIESAADR